MLKKIILFIILLSASPSVLTVSAAQVNGIEEMIMHSNQAYRDGDYQQVIADLRQITGSGVKNGYLYYNLGNAFFKNDQLGHAILNYKRALMYLPRNPDLNFNLSHALDQTLDEIPKNTGFVQMTFFWLNSLTLREMFNIFAAINLAFWAILVLRFFRKSEWSYYALIVIFAFWSTGAVSFGLKWYQSANDTRAVILDKEVDIHAGPDSKDTILFKLHEGTIVQFERSEDEWSLVSLSDSKRGWLKNTAMELVKPAEKIVPDASTYNKILSEEKNAIRRHK